jgi:two-component system cell cycle response regulator
MTTSGHNQPPGKDTDEDRLNDLLSEDVLTLDLVSAFAGDRALSKAEALVINRKMKSLGDRFYSDLLYAITHQYFEGENAKALWREIVRHKYEMSSALKRNIRVVVAALDYLSNITGDIVSTTLIAEDHIADIIDASLRDGLTGLFSHAFFYRRTDFEIKRSKRYGAPVSLMMLDIDDFKAINDRYGHQEGDAILNVVGSVIRKETRDTDVCCRYGGEEFAILLPSTDPREALVLAERLRAAIQNEHPYERNVTVSIGLTAVTGASRSSAQKLVKEADSALYAAKAKGKNCVVVRG